jgi:hypothetical protein
MWNRVAALRSTPHARDASSFPGRYPASTYCGQIVDVAASSHRTASVTYIPASAIVDTPAR